jgi:tRNA nucleotidyltransferase (CCA-adding enzyme)
MTADRLKVIATFDLKHEQQDRRTEQRATNQFWQEFHVRGQAEVAKDRIMAMEVYLVGGAVRDELLGLPVKERDWCVVGATPEELVDLGYRPVGKDFPVFLHPDTAEEYALARTERKTAAGYHGFSFYTAPNVTIEQDLGRRDLTVNAIAKNEDDQIIDPFNGRRDIKKKLLRHVSEAFAEDPVRILRTARFATRFYSMGFRIAEETMQLMKSMVRDGEVNSLVPDRVWKETAIALGEAQPHIYFDVLRTCGALKEIFPEIDALFGVPQPGKWHPEIDTGIHTLMVLQQAALMSDEIDVRFAGLVHDLGKATTRKNDLPQHPGHEARGVKLIRSLAKRLPVPNAYRDLACLAAEFHTLCHRAFELRASTILKVLNRADAFRRPDRFEKLMLACEADARGRAGFEDRDYPQADFFRSAYRSAASVDIDDLVEGTLSGAEIGKKIHLRRQRAIERFRKDYEPPK